ncbi:Helicase [Zea mays]|uniref:Helicase n=1 Tax=Zea mays TaxID=4577 RepID=A0A1D6FJ47_MAIZE|nr:Helicase [Zea mays]
MTSWYETVKHFNNLLHEKHVYKMHNIKFGLHPGEFNFRHLNGPMELYLNQQTIVEPYTVPIQMPPFPKHIFLNLADIAELPNRTLVDIMAIVVHLDTIHRTMWGPFRKIVIMDVKWSLHIIKVWGDLLNENALRWALAKEDYGIIIGTMFRRFRRQECLESSDHIAIHFNLFHHNTHYFEQDDGGVLFAEDDDEAVFDDDDEEEGYLFSRPDGESGEDIGIDETQDAFTVTPDIPDPYDKVDLAPLEAPSQLRRLWECADVDARHFRDNIRFFNGHFSFTSMYIVAFTLVDILRGNPYSKHLRSMGHIDNVEDYHITLNLDQMLDQKLYNAPITLEVAAVWIEGSERRGEHGWHANIPKSNVSMDEVDTYHEQHRTRDAYDDETGIFNPILHGKRLFQQFAVDTYIKIESSRLDFICKNQSRLREDLYKGLSPQDRPDLVVRIFRAKLEELKKRLTKQHILGKIWAYVYVVEFQKRGLPHAHFVLIMQRKYKLTCPEQYDLLISAEIPDKKKYPQLYKMVIKHMMNGPCGLLNPKCPCTKVRASCKNHYPRAFSNATLQGKDSYPIYRRRDDGCKEKVRGCELDNRWVVPYNPHLLRLFNCDINVEACGSIKDVKYLFKYIYRGHDRASVAVREANKDDGDVDEIKQYRDARWVTPPEALSQISPLVMQLELHLKNMHMVSFHERAKVNHVVQRPGADRSMLTAYFEANRQHEEARGIVYRDFPEWYTLQQGKVW